MHPCQKEGKKEGERGRHCDKCSEKRQCPLGNRCEWSGRLKGSVGDYCQKCPKKDNCPFN